MALAFERACSGWGLELPWLGADGWKKCIQTQAARGRGGGCCLAVLRITAREDRLAR